MQTFNRFPLERAGNRLQDALCRIIRHLGSGNRLTRFCHCCVETKRGTIRRVKYWQTILPILAALSASLALADDFKTTDGKEYKNVKVSRVEPDGLVLITKSGISKVYFAELPKGVQERFHYDPDKAAAYSAQQAADLEMLQQQQQKLAEQQNKDRSQQPVTQGERYWISGKIVGKSNDALLIECSGEAPAGYDPITGRVVLRNHPHFGVLAEGDHVEVFAIAIAAAQWGGTNHPYLHTFRAVQ